MSEEQIAEGRSEGTVPESVGPVEGDSMAPASTKASGIKLELIVCMRYLTIEFKCFAIVRKKLNHL